MHMGAGRVSVPSRLVSGAKGGSGALARLAGTGRYDMQSVSAPPENWRFLAIWRKSYQFLYQATDGVALSVAETPCPETKV